MTKRFPALLAATLGCATVAWADQPSQNDLQKQVADLQAQVQELKSQRNAPAYTAKDVDATVDSILRDADRRSQLLAEAGGFMGGWDNGFHIRSADGNYDLRPYFLFQFRSVTNLGDFGDSDNSDDGFEISRMKFGVEGHAISRKLKYNFSWDSGENRGGGSLQLENANISYQFADAWSFRVGQFKDNWTHEETVAAGRQLAVDRSLLNEILGGGMTDYVQGIALMYDGGNFQAELAYHDGINTDNTSFQDVNANFGVSGRVQMLLSGDWAAYQDFSAMGNKKDLLVIGAGGDWTQTGDLNTYFHTVDAQWETTGGLGVYGAFVGNYTDFGGGGEDAYTWGFLVQAGYMLNAQWEIFGRADWIQFDSDNVQVPEENVYEITAGVNYYLKGHNAKVTIDATWLPNGSPVNATNIGVIGQSNDDDQFLIRGQFQLAI